MIKKIKIILLLFAFFAFNAVINAQSSFCAGIVVETFAMDPQSGSHNYFGVKVTLDQAYNQNITVNGYVYDEGNGMNTDHPFTLTVTAGNLIAETVGNFYETDPTATGVCEISSQSPSTVTSGGVTFSTQCIESSSPLVRLNAIGQIHNDYQDFLLTYITDQNLDLSDTANLKQVIETKTSEFLTSKGIAYTYYPGVNFAPVSNSIPYSSSNHSTGGVTILSSLETLLGNYDENDDAGFFTSLNSLQQQAINLSDPLEVYTVGIPVTVAIYSLNYWKNNAETWIDIFTEQDSIRNLNTSAYRNRADFNNGELIDIYSKNSGPNNFSLDEQIKNFKKCKVGLGQLGFADVTGGMLVLRVEWS